MVFDYVQMVYDLAATKLPAHAYTKEAMFAKQFGLPGIKINMSLIPAIAKDGIAPGLDANGNYVPQRAVRAVFPTDDSAFESMKSLIKAGLEEDAIIQGKRDARLSKIVDEIEKTLPKTEELIEDVEIEQANRDLESDLYNSGVKYSLRGYTEKQKDNWKNSKRIVLFENNQQYREFIKKSKEDVQYNKKIYFGAISEDLASLIRKNTKIEVEGFNCSLSSYEIRKMFKDHGNSAIEEPRGQRAITEDDIVNIPLVIQSPDVVYKSPNEYNGKPAILFKKNFTQNEKTTVVAVVSDKHIDLFVQTSYVGVKKGNLATPIGEQAPINTPGANSGTVSSSKISQREPDVNNSLLGSDNFSNRELLANALMETAQNDAERQKLEQYKAKVNEINELENHLKEVNAKIKEISFSKGKRDQAALRELKEEKVKTENRINIFDKQLLRIEASKPLRDILTRERQNFKKAQSEKKNRIGMRLIRFFPFQCGFLIWWRYGDSNPRPFDCQSNALANCAIPPSTYNVNRFTCPCQQFSL